MNGLNVFDALIERQITPGKPTKACKKPLRTRRIASKNPVKITKKCSQLACVLIDAVTVHFKAMTNSILNVIVVLVVTSTTKRSNRSLVE
jgi:hypothetical protein